MYKAYYKYSLSRKLPPTRKYYFPFLQWRASFLPLKINNKIKQIKMTKLQHSNGLPAAQLHILCSYKRFTKLAINSKKSQGKLEVYFFEWETYTQAQQAENWLTQQQQLNVMGYPYGLLNLKTKAKIASSSFCCIFFSFQEISSPLHFFSWPSLFCPPLLFFYFWRFPLFAEIFFNPSLAYTTVKYAWYLKSTVNSEIKLNSSLPLYERENNGYLSIRLLYSAITWLWLANSSFLPPS